jgi:predicted TIM-barrel fold metal-dependent hydrolase
MKQKAKSMIIDIHNHPDWHGHDLTKFLENMRVHHIDKSWLLSWESPADEYSPDNIPYIPDTGANGPIPFARCVSYAERAPEKFILGYAPDPRRPGAIDRLQAAINIYGVRIYGELKLRMMYDNPDAISMYRFCGEKGLPVIVHLDYEISDETRYPRPNWWYGGGIEALERAVRACPDTAFIGHAPGFWSHISADGQHNKVSYPAGKVIPGGKLVDMLNQYSNLYCDISAGSGRNALNRDPEFARLFLMEFQDRVLYGRDSFSNIHQEFLNTLGLPAQVLEKIYSGNALRLVPVK